MNITLITLKELFSVCKLADYSQVELKNNFFFTAATDEENSLVCPTDMLPNNTIEREDSWRCMKISGVLDFSLIGILAGIANVLQKAKIGIFVISTYNTDYIFVKAEHLTNAQNALKNAGYLFE